MFAVADATLMRQNIKALAADQLSEKELDKGRIEVLPVQWRKHLNLDVRQAASESHSHARGHCLSGPQDSLCLAKNWCTSRPSDSHTLLLCRFQALPQHIDGHIQDDSLSHAVACH